MNVPVPGGGTGDLGWFLGILIGMVVLSVVMMYIFIKKGYMDVKAYLKE